MADSVITSEHALIDPDSVCAMARSIRLHVLAANPEQVTIHLAPDAAMELAAIILRNDPRAARAAPVTALCEAWHDDVPDITPPLNGALVGLMAGLATIGAWSIILWVLP